MTWRQIFVIVMGHGHCSVAGREIGRSVLLQRRHVQGGEIGLRFFDALGGGLREPGARRR